MIPRQWAAYKIAYEEREDREDWRIAQLTAQYAEAHRNTQKNPYRYTPPDFMHRGKKYRPKPKRVAGSVVAQQARAMAAMWNQRIGYNPSTKGD